MSWGEGVQGKTRGADGTRLSRILRLVLLAEAAALVLAAAGCGDLPLVDTLQRESPGELRFSPSSAAVPSETSYTFSVTGGITPYSITSGSVTVASVGENTWQFPGQTVTAGYQDFPLGASDWAGKTTSAVLRVYSGMAPQLNVSEVILPAGASWTFQASGGLPLPDYAWEVNGAPQPSGPSPNDSYVFAFTAPGAYVVAVFDSLDASHAATVEVVTNTAGGPLSITPTSAVVLPGGTIAFTALGGNLDYDFSCPDGGSIDNTNPASFVAPAGTGSYRILLTDSGGGGPVEAVAEVTSTGEALVISPSGPTVSAVGDEVQFSASGGSPYTAEPYYTFSTNKADMGTVDPATGLYRQMGEGNVVVSVMDSAGLKDNTLVKWKP